MNIQAVLGIIFLPLLVVTMLFLPVLYTIKKGRSLKKPLILNLCSFFGLLLLSVILPLGGFIDVQAASDALPGGGFSSDGLGYLAAALSTGLGSIGCGIAVGGAAPAAIGAVAEEPESFSKALIFVVLGEGVAIYGVLIAILILGQLG